MTQLLQLRHRTTRRRLHGAMRCRRLLASFECSAGWSRSTSPSSGTETNSVFCLSTDDPSLDFQLHFSIVQWFRGSSSSGRCALASVLLIFLSGGGEAFPGSPERGNFYFHAVCCLIFFFFPFVETIQQLITKYPEFSPVYDGKGAGRRKSCCQLISEEKELMQ